MSIVKGTLIALALAFSATAPAFAADGGRDDGQAWLLNPGPIYSAPTARIATPRARTAVTHARRATTFRMARDLNMSGS
ncbi:MAG: hypothetical protein AB7K64_05940 [Variibacter sp.]